MRPHVACEADIEQVLERRPADGGTERNRQVAHGRRRSPAALDGSGADGTELGDDLVVRQVLPFADLQLVHTVDPVVRVDDLVERNTASQLVHELPHRRLSVTRAEDVQRHLAHVPARAVRRHRPLIRRERRREISEANELLFGEDARLGALDAILVHVRMLLVMASSIKRSTRRLR